jgi:lantibiotic biosynthesis protein
MFHKLHVSIEAAVPAGHSLLTGKLGLVLYYFSLYEGLGENEYADKAIDLLEAVMNQKDDELPLLAGTGFSTGTAGLGYILSLMKTSELVEIDLQEDLGELDASLAEIAMKQIVEEDRNDYLHGAMGVVHYFITRSKEPYIRTYLEKLVEAFCDKAVVTEEGIWFRNFIIDQREKERIDTGLSHGNAGFLLILLNVLEAGILERKVREVVTKGIRFLISRQMKPDPNNEQHTFFPFSVNCSNFSDTYFSRRLAWCYGDLNIILLLYRASFLLHEPAWKELADTLAVQTVARQDETATLAADSHFCHGTAGLAQFYKTLYALTGNGIFSAATDYWMQKTVELLEVECRENWYSGKECDLLNGLPGINLVLLSYITKKELTWSRSLLL